MEARLASTQYCIGAVADPKYRYYLNLTNQTPIRSKPIRSKPREEAWLDAYLDELLAKGIITQILPHEQPAMVTPLLLVPQAQSG